MRAFRTAETSVYCLTVLAFLFYPLAAAVFALPAEPQGCTRCKHTAATTPRRPGTFCTLTYKTRPALSAHEQAPVSRTITLCAEGCCLLHPDQRVVSSIAKFVSPDATAGVHRPERRSARVEPLLIALAPDLPSLYRPPRSHG
jgi:hypothetical protein